MAALLRSGKFLRVVSGAARQAQVGQPANQGSEFALTSTKPDSSSSLSMPTASFESSQSGSSFQTSWSLHNLQGALPALSAVHGPTSDGDHKRDPLLEFFATEPLKEDEFEKAIEIACPEKNGQAAFKADAAVEHSEKPALTQEKAEPSAGLNLFKTDPQLRWSEESPEPSTPASPAATVATDNDSRTQTPPPTDTVSPAPAPVTEAPPELSQVEAVEVATTAVETSQPGITSAFEAVAAAATQPPSFVDFVGVQGATHVVPVVPLADASNAGVTTWYPLPVVCQMFRQQGRYWDLEMLLEGSHGIRPEDRQMVYFWTLQSYADVGLFDRAVALSGQLHLEGLGHHFPEYHALMSSFAAAHTSFAPTLPYSAYAEAPNHGGSTAVTTADVSLVTTPRSSCPPTPAPADCEVIANGGRRRASAASSERRPEHSKAHRRSNMKVQLLSRRFKKALFDEDVNESMKAFNDLRDLDGGFVNGGFVKSLSVTELSAFIELMVKEDRVAEATGLAGEMLAQDLYPLPKIFRFLLNKLASAGDVEAVTRLGDGLTSKVKKEVSFDNRLCNAYLASGRGAEYLDLLTRALDDLIESGSVDDTARVQSIKDKFPRGGAMGLLESNPELVEAYTAMAHKFLILGYVAPMNVLWTYHFIGGRHDLAEPLWDKYVKACPQIMFQKVCQTARARADPDLAQRLVRLLENAETVTVGARGIAYSCLLDVLAARKEYARGVQALKEGLESGIKIEDVNRTALKRLKEGLEATTTEKFPFQIPKKTNITPPVASGKPLKDISDDGDSVCEAASDTMSLVKFSN